MALVTNATSVYGAEQTATQKCLHHIEEAKDNQQRKAAIAFKDCVRKETSTIQLIKWPDDADKEERKAKKERIKAEKELEKQVKLKEKERIKAEKELEKERIKAEKAAKKAEKKLLKEKRKQACKANPKSEECKNLTKNQAKKLLEKIKKIGKKKTN